MWFWLTGAGGWLPQFPLLRTGAYNFFTPQTQRSVVAGKTLAMAGFLIGLVAFGPTSLEIVGPMCSTFAIAMFAAPFAQVCVCVCRGWVGGWMGGWVDGWMGGWVGGWVGGWMGGWRFGKDSCPGGSTSHPAMQCGRTLATGRVGHVVVV